MMVLILPQMEGGKSPRRPLNKKIAAIAKITKSRPKTTTTSHTGTKPTTPKARNTPTCMVLSASGSSTIPNFDSAFSQRAAQPSKASVHPAIRHSTSARSYKRFKIAATISGVIKMRRSESALGR